MLLRFRGIATDNFDMTAAQTEVNLLSKLTYHLLSPYRTAVQYSLQLALLQALCKRCETRVRIDKIQARWDELVATAE